MKRSTAALLIAIMLHVILILLFVILTMLVPAKPKQTVEKERRMKVSLKERPKVKRDALIKNSETPTKALPMPKGKQLKKLVQKPFIKPKPPSKKPTPVKKRPPKKPKSKPIKKKPKTAPVPPKKPYIKTPKPKPKKVVTPPIKKEVPKEVPKESSDLYNLLSQPSKSKPKEEAKQSSQQSKINQDINELYGDVFGELSAGEQKYILDNQEIMRRITQQVLNRVGSVNLKGDLRVNTSNVIEFYLYPNGDISDIKFIQKSGYFVLDHTTRETIEYAYAKYPRPEQKTLIRYKVGYYLKGY
jgi:outer membrane biosynthesis protein TonB